MRGTFSDQGGLFRAHRKPINQVIDKGQFVTPAQLTAGYRYLAVGVSIKLE
jgi:hypothetical protein